MNPEILAKARQTLLQMHADGVPDDAIEAWLAHNKLPPIKDVMEPGVRDYARAAGMGATLGFEDELAGAGAALAHPGNMAEAYTKERDAVRGNYKAAKVAAPWRMGAAELGGGLASAAIGGAAGAGVKGLGLGAKVLSGMLAGGATGGAAGVGYSEDHPVTSGLEGAAGGAALGAALPLAGAGISKTARALMRRFSPARTVADAAGHFMDPEAAALMAKREAVVPGTTVPAALTPDAAASVRVIGADPVVARAAQQESVGRIAAMQDKMREIGDQMEQTLAGRHADVDLPSNAPIRKLLAKNGLMATPHSSGADVIDLTVVQKLRNSLRIRAENMKGIARHEVGEDIKTLSTWLNHQAPDIGGLDRDYAVAIRAKKSEETLLKHIRQSRKSYSSSRAAGIEPGSPGASLPSMGGMMHKIMSPDRKLLAGEASRLLLQPGQIPPELLKAYARSARPTSGLGLASLLGLSEGAGKVSGGLLSDEER